ncbi:hypothetical protein [Jiangella alba]|uniref:hypothetical protein n=1 Tax=Jiangella alba TaxID=561176 RepID=UPI00114D2B7A|nr:hypothetical protein [Jiangella alba]
MTGDQLRDVPTPALVVDADVLDVTLVATPGDDPGGARPHRDRLPGAVGHAEQRRDTRAGIDARIASATGTGE